MSETITYSSRGKLIQAELFRAASTAAVVLAHGSDGITDDLNGPWASMMRDYGEQFSQAGLTALLPHYFEKTNTLPGVSAWRSMLLYGQAWEEALGDAVAHAQTLPGIARGRVALVGFSLGGHLSLRLRDRVPVVVELYAPYLTGLGSPADATAAHVQIHHGGNDQLVGFANAEQIASVLRDEGIRTDTIRYQEAGHGFIGADPKNSEARQLSRDRTIEFVSAHL